MFLKSKRSQKVGIVTALAAILVLLPSHFAAAGWFWDMTVGALMSEVTTWVFVMFRSVIAEITAILVRMLDVAVYARAYNSVPAIVTIWEILRDFANLFFILALIWMAFATIFNINKYRFQDMIYRFIIVAVLINFSMVIGGLVIDACQVLTNVFLNMIGNPGDKIGQYLNPSQLLIGTTSTGDSIDFTSAAGISLIFGVILSGMFMFSLLVAVLFALFRVIAIWGLLIVSPIAWMSYILPGTQKWWKQWWGYFLGWNLFLPVYLFILYLGLVFLSQGREVVQQIAGTRGTET